MKALLLASALVLAVATSAAAQVPIRTLEVDGSFVTPDTGSTADGQGFIRALVNGQVVVDTSGSTFNGQVASHMLNYSNWGAWSQTTPTVNTGAYAAGSPTPANQIPVSGTATYSGSYIGFVTVTGSNVFCAQPCAFTNDGTMTLNAHFGTGKVNLALTGGSQTNLSGSGTLFAGQNAQGNQNGPDGVAGTFATPLSGTIDCGPCSGNINNVATAKGSAKGTFFGPNAVQAAGVAVASGANAANSLKFAAGFGGTRQ
jgi:hypothetical protein